MDIAIKISAMALIASICALLIKKSNPEMSLTAAVAAAAVICIFCMPLFGDIISLMRDLFERSGMNKSLYEPIVKCVGIAVIIRLTSGLCRDASQSGIASAVELGGAAAALVTAAPLIKALMDTIDGLI